MYHKVEFPNSVVVQDLRRLINQIFKLIPLREEQGDWQHKIDTVLVELYGLHAMFGDQLDFLKLISILEGLKLYGNFEVYRGQVFNAITLLTELTNTIHG